MAAGKPASAWPTVLHVLRRSARLWGGSEAAIDGERRLDFAALLARSSRLGSGVRVLGLGQGERVAILADNSLEYLEAYFGVPSAGLVLLPLNSRLAADEIAYILSDAQCRTLIVGSGFEEIAESATAEL